MANNDQGGDADVQLKKRARRRLIGAIALVLLAVIVLPMVMDHEPRPTGPEIQVQIPSKNAPPTGAKPGAVQAVPPVAAFPQKQESKSAEAGDPPPTNAVVTKPLSEPATAPAKPAASPAPASKVAESNKKPDEADARALAALGGKSASAGGAWVVKLGAYRDQGNVKVLLGKLKEMGIPAYAEKLDSPQGPRTRVRAGPFADREAATRAQARIKTIGVDGPVEAKN